MTAAAAGDRTGTQVDGIEHLDVLVVGAGLTGVGAGHHLQRTCPWATYAIFEARDAIGGTWDLFKYPGLRSDSDMFTLGYSFRPWDGEKSIADGDSILRYIRDTAAEGGVQDRIRFHHRVVRAEWSSDDVRWHVTAERTDTGETVELTCSFLYGCTGYYRYDRGYLPDFPGMASFGGTLIHPQAWPEDFDATGKRIVVIGSGATAVTLVPALARTAAHVTMLQRSPSYIISRPAKDKIADVMRRVLPTSVSGPAIRWRNALMTQGFYRMSRRHPAAVRRVLLKGVAMQLPDGFDVGKHFTPSYDPWDQRVCAVPDGDLFRAIRKGAVSIVTDHIDTFTETGIRLRSGEELEADVIVTATGLELLFAGGIEVLIDGEPVQINERLTYKGMMLEGVPNLAFAIGYTNASWTLKADLTSDTVCRLLDHMRRTGMRRCTPTNRDGTEAGGPVMGLMSGYIQRAADRLPKQGTRFPWQVHQSYLRDYRAMKLKPVDDDAMAFSDPVDAVRAEPVAS